MTGFTAFVLVLLVTFLPSNLSLKLPQDYATALM